MCLADLLRGGGCSVRTSSFWSTVNVVSSVAWWAAKQRVSLECCLSSMLSQARAGSCHCSGELAATAAVGAASARCSRAQSRAVRTGKGQHAGSGETFLSGSQALTWLKHCRVWGERGREAGRTAGRTAGRAAGWTAGRAAGPYAETEGSRVNYDLSRVTGTFWN